ncbi:AzlD domain-containing protein [Limnochorda pilosa]|uniref:Branched-chain amino acid ABC transporter n=1 Tax=Limnochorda pilosa TaxID=1555112 RepID=A0A0K2SM29_LIMPI|nr:AzlD domain-containing protein [Limnochorda pilosa]BAS28155.1 branched-chain amino acid ABC transporter [Limnochorda pilosa]
MWSGEVWLGGLLLGLATYSARSLPLFLGLRPSERIARYLRYVAPSVVAALLVPSLLLFDGAWIPPMKNPALLAALPTAWVAYRSRSLGWTTVAGVAAFALLSRWLG